MSQATNQSGRIVRAGERHDLGLRVAGLLAGAWRQNNQAAVNLSETELTEITPLLCQTGAGALAWSRLAHTPLAETAAGNSLQEVYRQARLSSLIHEREIVYVLSLLRAEGIEPVLVKGWAMSRLYPERALRPCGDIDLCVRPDQFARATAALKCLENIDGHYVDLHCGFERIGLVQRPNNARREVSTGSGSDRVSVDQHATSQVPNHQGAPRRWTLDIGHWTTLYERSQIVSLNGTPVRILSDEDHLRLLCQHLFRSGARRPAWLCDVALLVEMRSVPGVVATGPDDQRANAKDQSLRASINTFNWDVCLGAGPTDANWIASAIGLARELLGANIDHTPFADVKLPRWLAPAVLQQWGGRVQSPTSKVQRQESSRGHWTLDIRLLTDLYSRWDNPIRAVAGVGGEFNNRPRFPYRVAESLKRVSGL